MQASQPSQAPKPNSPQSSKSPTKSPKTSESLSQPSLSQVPKKPSTLSKQKKLTKSQSKSQALSQQAPPDSGLSFSTSLDEKNQQNAALKKQSTGNILVEDDIEKILAGLTDSLNVNSQECDSRYEKRKREENGTDEKSSKVQKTTQDQTPSSDQKQQSDTKDDEFDWKGDDVTPSNSLVKRFF